MLTPKSLLRHPAVVSPLENFTSGEFRKILPDTRESQKNTRRVLLCSGKVYYELDEKRQELKADHVAIVRLEQFYPLGNDVLLDALKDYPAGVDLVWVQEEPANMGAWPFMKVRFGDFLAEHNYKLRRVSRVESASPATGSANTHKLEQGELVNEAFANCN